MTRPGVVILALLLIASALGGLVYWIVPHLESYEHEVIENVSEKVRRNPFLAMERFLARLGYVLETSRRSAVLDTIPDEQDTIMLEYSKELFTEARTKRLMEWMERGGHLVLEILPQGPQKDGAAKNQLLQRLDLRPVQPVPGDKPVFQDTQRKLQAGTQTFTIDPGFRAAWLEDGSGSAEVWWADGVPAVLRYRFGAGRLTLIPSRNLWRNNRIGRYDHAAFLVQLLGPAHGKLWVLSNVKVESLLQIIWRQARFAVIASTLTLALVLWSLNNRFGPLRIPQHRRRRSLGEHVQAMANFAWHHGHAGNLLAAARAEVRQRAELRHPGFQSRVSDQYAWLAERIHVSAQAVRHAFDTQADRSDSLIETVTLLQKLRASL